MTHGDDKNPNAPIQSANDSKIADRTQRIEKTQRIESPQPADKTQRIERPPSQPSASQRPAPAGDESGFQVGDVIRDRFKLETLLGKGGMGVVFAALDRRKLEVQDPNPHVAIKILSADFRQHPDALVALQREARKAQTLAHPNVVTVFDFDRDGDSVFMTMERLRGRSLEAYVREARNQGLSREVALPIIRGIAEGLAYAHRKGIVHSDLKPGNIFVLEDGTPKILDFGIARAVPSLAEKEKDVFDAASLGAYTEAYATLEMVDGVDPHPADDVYALGLIAYELLAGAHPYKRLGAYKARAEGIRPAAPKSLSKREWRVLESAISIDRVARPKDAAEFNQKFFGRTTFQKSLVAALVVLALLSCGLWYRSYTLSGPAVPFDQLPAETQTQFNKLMESGNREWQFFSKEQNSMALWDAVDQFADAYRLHPRNRDASAALKRVADAFIDATKSDPQRQREVVDTLAAKSEYLEKYPPIVAIRKR